MFVEPTEAVAVEILIVSFFLLREELFRLELFEVSSLMRHEVMVGIG